MSILRDSWLTMTECDYLANPTGWSVKSGSTASHTYLILNLTLTLTCLTLNLALIGAVGGF